MILAWACALLLSATSFLLSKTLPPSTTNDASSFVQTKTHAETSAISKTPETSAISKTPETSAESKTPRGAMEPLRSYQDVLYYGDVALDGQRFEVIFDTGSSDSWLLRAGARLPPDSGQRPGYRGAVAGAQQQLRYGSGTVTAKAARANALLAGVTLDFPFLAADDVTSLGDVFAQGHLDGLLSLGLPELSVAGQPSLMDALYAQKVVAARQFTVMLASPGPRLAFGGVDPALDPADIAWRPVMPGGYWQVRLDKAVAGTVALGPYDRCVVDSGSSFVIAPSAHIDRLAAALAAGEQLKLHFGDLVLVLDAQDLQRNGELALQAYDSPDGVDTFVLGDVFLRRYATVFDQDNRRVGFHLR